jgi:DNA-binding transcriptional regulator YiaG
MITEQMQAVLDRASAMPRLPADRGRRREIRMAAGLRAKDVAEAIGTTGTNVGRWERVCDPRPGSRLHVAYAEFLAVLEERFGG